MHDPARHDQPDELFGLAGTFPRPGWVVLDAAREERFTGELVVDTNPEVRVYFDRGRIYLAERVTDPPLGSRLVDAGALSSVQLDRGSVRVGDAEHLGRLFERVPSVDRHAVLVTSELMTEECVGWVAAQRVPAAEAHPYRHHLSGMHRWELDDEVEQVAAAELLPAPAVDAEPVLLAGPHSLLGPDENFDDMIHWEEPGFLDERADRPVLPPGVSVPVAAPPIDVRPPDPPVISGDWIDRLETEGLPEHGSDPLATVKPLPTVAVEPIDRFEVIWPSGEIDESFGATETAPTVGRLDPDHDRVGPTARVARPRESLVVDQRLSAEAVVAAAFEATTVLDRDGDGTPDLFDDFDLPVDDDYADADLDAPRQPVDDDGATDEVVLAVRRAVASIDTGSLATRRRLAEVARGDQADASNLVLPGRIAVRAEQSDWMPSATTRSVFDEPTVAPVPVAEAPAVPVVVQETPPVQVELDSEPTVERTSALRRLIASLRRR